MTNIFLLHINQFIQLHLIYYTRASGMSKIVFQLRNILGLMPEVNMP